MNNVSFAQFDLNPLILKALSACGYTEPTSIQTQSIPDILNGKDLIASAQTGTGKTAAFVLPTLHRLSLGKSGHKARALILTPTRELADQIMRATSKYGKFLRLRTISLIGGMPYHQQLRNLSGNVDIIVATPGRLLDHIENHKLDLSHVETLILDEADRMLDMGFIDDIKKIAKQTPNQRQTLLFSATVDDRVSQISAQLLKNPVRISTASSKVTADHIKSELYVVDNLQHKLRLFLHLLKEHHIYKAIIFSATKMHTEKLAKQLREEGYSATAMHGDMKQNARNRTIEQLRNNKVQFLVATDVAARGIDITDISHVINFDLPKTSEDYVHRIGRTGRAGKSGHAISFALSSEARQVKSIERYIKQTFEITVISGFEPSKELYVDAPAKNKRGNSRSRPQRSGGDRPRRAHGDRPRRDSDDRPRRDRGDRPRRDGDDRPKRAHSDRPRRDSDDRPRRDRGDRPQRAAGEDRPRRAHGDRPQRFGDDRPRRDRSDRPQRADDDRPRRDRGDRPRRDSDDRPRRTHGDRPQRSGDDRPRRASGNRPSRSGGSEGRGRERSFNSASARPKKKR